MLDWIKLENILQDHIFLENKRHGEFIYKNINSLRPSDAYMRRLGACLAPSHYLNQWWNIVNCTLGNKVQWNFNRNLNIFIQENAYENVICRIVVILSRPQWVKNSTSLLPGSGNNVTCSAAGHYLNQCRLISVKCGPSGINFTETRI